MARWVWVSTAAVAGGVAVALLQPEKGASARGGVGMLQDASGARYEVRSPPRPPRRRLDALLERASRWSMPELFREPQDLEARKRRAIVLLIGPVVAALVALRLLRRRFSP